MGLVRADCVGSGKGVMVVATLSSLLPLSPGLVGTSETGKLLHRRIDMINQNRTWKLRWTVLALFAVFALGATTLTDAQEGTRTVAEIQADINALQAELRAMSATHVPAVPPMVAPHAAVPRGMGPAIGPRAALPSVMPAPRRTYFQAAVNYLTPASVTAESAQNTALASVGGGTVARVETKYPRYGMEYVVIIVHGDYRYNVHVSAHTGTVTSIRPHLITQVYNVPGVIDVETAKSIALQSADGGIITGCKLVFKRREGITVYHIHVANGQNEHSIELLASTGAVYQVRNTFKP